MGRPVVREQLLDAIPVTGKAFQVVEGDFVTSEEGTGLVHLAPAFGADDSPEQHAADVYKSSHETADHALVEALTGDAQSANHWLEELGVAFTHDPDGGYRLARCGGASGGPSRPWSCCWRAARCCTPPTSRGSVRAW